MDLDLEGRHALVCGGSDGIGRAAAHELALIGADVTVLARPRIDRVVRDRVAASSRPARGVPAGMRAQVPLGRIAEPAEIAAAIAFLCTPAAGDITGASLPVDGGRMASI